MRIAVDAMGGDNAPEAIVSGGVAAAPDLGAGIVLVGAGALLGLGRVPGGDRPAIAAVLPTQTAHPAILLDVGANVDCKPHHLLQFALMGSAYARSVLGAAEPRVGLLSNGTEEGKGSDLVLAATPLLRDSGLTFVGNVEARDFF